MAADILGEKKDRLVFRSSPERLLKHLETNPTEDIYLHDVDTALSPDLRVFFKSLLPVKAKQQITRAHLENVIENARKKGIDFR